MRLLVTGASGQVGRALQAAAGPRHAVVPLTHADLPVEDAKACMAAVTAARPDWIVHTAALTDVDACERDPARAHAVNAIGAGNLAEAAAKASCRMVLVSTDYVFDGARGQYKEGEPTGPLNHYGRSKLEGERLVQAALPGAVVARTSAVFGPHKTNFVAWVRRSLQAGLPVKAARDQWVTPTCADDVARQVLALVEAGEHGVWHTAGAERLDRVEMARRIAAHAGLDPSPIVPVEMGSLPWLAQRPRDSSLDTTKVRRLVAPMGFNDALDTMGALA